MALDLVDDHDLGHGYVHAALFHAGDDDFVEGVTSFVVDGLARQEPAAVVARASRIEAVRDALGAAACEVAFVDVTEAGRNPSRLISALSDAVAEHRPPGRRMRGVGEPVWPGRSPAELVECQHNESLLNAAAAELQGLTLLCAYDTSALEPAVVDAARRTHPVLASGGRSQVSADYHGREGVRPVLDDPLPEPEQPYVQMAIDAGTLASVRDFVAQRALEAGLDRKRRKDLVLAVGEAAANSVRHGGGSGVLRCWFDDVTVVHELRDAGHIDELLVGRRRPTAERPGGWGLWLINELCDLVQLRSSDEGTVIRIHMATPGPAPQHWH